MGGKRGVDDHHITDIKHVFDTIAAPMLEGHGIGYETTGTLLCAAGNNPSSPIGTSCTIQNLDRHQAQA